MTGSSDGTLEVLVVDDEEPALEDLAYLLRQHPRIGSVVTASDATEALRRLRALCHRRKRLQRHRGGRHPDHHHR